MSTIFISHSSKDQTVARTLCAALENRGLTCWIASRDVGAGENFQELIVTAIRSAKVMVLVFSDNANNSTEIKKELALASQHKVPVIPARVEDVVARRGARLRAGHPAVDQPVQRLGNRDRDALRPRPTNRAAAARRRASRNNPSRPIAETVSRPAASQPADSQICCHQRSRHQAACRDAGGRCGLRWY